MFVDFLTSTLLRAQNTTLLSKVQWRFFQILWPFQKTQTLNICRNLNLVINPRPFEGICTFCFFSYQNLLGLYESPAQFQRPWTQLNSSFSFILCSQWEFRQFRGFISRDYWDFCLGDDFSTFLFAKCNLWGAIHKIIWLGFCVFFCKMSWARNQSDNMNLNKAFR